MDDALTWLSRDLIPALKTALADRLVEARVSGGPVGGRVNKPVWHVG